MRISLFFPFSINKWSWFSLFHLRIYCSMLGSDEEDVKLLEESDDNVYVNIRHTKDFRFVTVNKFSITTSKVLICKHFLVDICKMSTSILVGLDYICDNSLGLPHKCSWSFVWHDISMGVWRTSPLYSWAPSGMPLFVYRCCKRGPTCWLSLSPLFSRGSIF